jgi:hypothetical protein
MNDNTAQIKGSLISADLLGKIYISEAAGQDGYHLFHLNE